MLLKSFDTIIPLPAFYPIRVYSMRKQLQVLARYIICCLVLMVLLPRAVKAQQRGSDSLLVDSLQDYEVVLSGLASEFVNSPDERTRVSSAYYFVKYMVKALKMPGSYTHPFDSLKAVSILRAPDDYFRIFTWQLRLDNGVYRNYGVIQMNPRKYPGKALELKEGLKPYYPLIDRSDSIKQPLDTVLSSEFWFGALYYQLAMKKIGRKNYYFLFGFDGHNSLSNKKLVDVLSFNEGKPEFGAPLFKIGKKLQQRFILQYSEEASISLRFLPKEDIITFDHLMSAQAHDYNNPDAYVPDGTYDYLEFENNLWEKKELLFQKKKISGRP